MSPKYCPKCNITWEQKENIYDHFRLKGHTKEESTEYAESYGCTKETPRHFTANMIGIENKSYDGVSFWQCLDCHSVFNRWTMKEVSKRFGMR